MTMKQMVPGGNDDSLNETDCLIDDANMENSGGQMDYGDDGDNFDDDFMPSQHSSGLNASSSVYASYSSPESKQYMQHNQLQLQQQQQQQQLAGQQPTSNKIRKRSANQAYEYLTSLPDSKKFQDWLSKNETDFTWVHKRNSMTNAGKKYYYICNFRIKKGYIRCPAVIYALFPNNTDSTVMVYSCGEHEHRRIASPHHGEPKYSMPAAASSSAASSSIVAPLPPPPPLAPLGPPTMMPPLASSSSLMCKRNYSPQSFQQQQIQQQQQRQRVNNSTNNNIIPQPNVNNPKTGTKLNQLSNGVGADLGNFSFYIQLLNV